MASELAGIGLEKCLTHDGDGTVLSANVCSYIPRNADPQTAAADVAANSGSTAPASDHNRQMDGDPQ